VKDHKYMKMEDIFALALFQLMTAVRLVEALSRTPLACSLKEERPPFPSQELAFWWS
jgi:hypothetical protein